MSADKRARAVDLAAARIAADAGFHDIARELFARHGITYVGGPELAAAAPRNGPRS